MGKQIFHYSAKSLLSWFGDVKNELNSNDLTRVVTTAEILLKCHQDEFTELN